MKPIVVPLFSVAVLLGVASRSAVADILVLRDGRQLVGQVQEVSAEAVMFRFEREAQQVAASFARDQLTPHTWYVVRSQAIGEDAAARLELARYSIDEGLFAVAERELARVEELDPKLEDEVAAERRRAQEGAAASLLALARAALEKGDLDEAWRLDAIILTRYRGTESRDGAGELLATLEQKRAVQAEEQRKARAAGEAEEEAARRDRVLQPAAALLDQGDGRNRAGLRSDDLNDAVRLFAGAERAYRTAAARLDEIEQENGNDAVLVGLVVERRRAALRGAAEAHLNTGSLYLVRGSYVRAAQHANEALAVDPGNDAARAFRARVELAAAEASGRRFRRGR